MCSPESKAATAESKASPTPNKEEIEQQEAQQQNTTHQLLARQLEYYFSTQNLQKDTYLSTLRGLNDGYVPISIVANFGKVQALVPSSAALEGVQAAATEHSELLEIVAIDSETGKKIASGQTEKKTVLAVGPVSGQAAIPMERISISHGGTAGAVATVTPVVTKQVVTTVPTPSSRSSRGVQNTIILRETPESVTEENIRELFAFDACPPIESVNQDVQNFWFVTLDTTSRDAMVDVMFRLRTQTFPAGEPVKARLKSSAAPSVSPSPINFVPTHTNFDPSLFAPSLAVNNQQQQSTSSGKKKRSKKGQSNKGKNNHQHQQQHQQNTKAQGNKANGGNQSKQNAKNDKATKKEEKRQEPPKMGEEDFPSLPPMDENSNKKIEVEKVPDQRSDCDDDEFDKGRRTSGFSDSSSTATTSTASTPNPSQPSSFIAGGYAAALRKAAAPQPPVVKKPVASTATRSSSSGSKSGAMNGTKSKGNNAKKHHQQQQWEEEEEAPPAVNIQPPSWGNGRSFADILSTSQQQQ